MAKPGTQGGAWTVRRGVLILALTFLLGGMAPRQAWEGARFEEAPGKALSTSEFSRIVTEFSEEGGYFRSDNLISNETSYLQILDRLKELGGTGGAYLGVGPEQNFTYIAHVRPEIAFIIDIRRQAVIQHLMFKAIFHLGDTRAKFLSVLFSKPIVGTAPGKEATVGDLVAYFTETPTSQAAFARNLARIADVITNTFKIPLDPDDLSMLDHVFSAFREENLNLRYQSGFYGYPYGNYGYRSRYSWSSFPTLQDLMLETDQHGKPGHFLASRDAFEFVRSLHEKNRIIPVVGDFAGSKALAAVASYLKKNGYTVTVFYTSNVEQYLFSNGVFDGFARNVERLPITEKSLFIRAYPNNQRMPHPAQTLGHRLTTLMEKIGVFVQDYHDGLYQDYYSLVTTHYIAATR